MEITTDVLLKGTEWTKGLEKLAPIFKNRTHYSIYMLAISVGIMYDQRIEKPTENGEETKSVPRNVIQNNDNGKLDFMFQAAILSTGTETFLEEKRLELAFGEKTEFNRLAFLTQYANFGITKLNEQIGDTTIETMENLKNFLVSTVEGSNLDISTLPDDILLED
jgi:hypothetical protein